MLFFNGIQTENLSIEATDFLKQRIFLKLFSLVWVYKRKKIDNRVVTGTCMYDIFMRQHPMNEMVV